jgi:hypothetical protein
MRAGCCRREWRKGRHALRRAGPTPDPITGRTHPGGVRGPAIPGLCRSIHADVCFTVSGSSGAIGRVDTAPRGSSASASSSQAGGSRGMPSVPIWSLMRPVTKPSTSPPRTTRSPRSSSDRKKLSHSIGLQAESNATINTVRLTFAVRPAFASRGRLVAHEGPNGIVDTASNPLIGNDEGDWGEDGTFIILPRTRGITGLPSHVGLASPPCTTPVGK